MKVFVNSEEREISVDMASTLNEVVRQVESTLPQGQMITEVALNDRVLESNWFQNAGKTYVLDDDTLSIRVEESAVIGNQALSISKSTLQLLLIDFEKIADSFRMQDDTEANTLFVQGIENLQWFLKLLEDSTFLLGRPLENIKDGDDLFMKHINELGEKLDKIIQVQSQKDWILLADMIEYEMLPALKKIGEIYAILDL